MDPALPPVAVVIPLHNGGPWIRETLASVDAQTHPPAEVLVIDDGSTDDGPTIASRVPGVRVRKLSLPSIGGAGPGRQDGFEQTSAPFVAFLDQDDYWHPDHLRLLAKALAERPDCPAAVGGTGTFDGETPPAYRTPDFRPTSLDLWDTFPLHQILSPSGVVIRRSALAAIGGWPTDGPVTDFLVWYRLSLDRPFVENPSFTCGKRTHGASKTVDIQQNSRATYLQYRASRLGPLAEERIERVPEDAVRLRQRLDALTAGGLLASAYESNGADLIREAAPALERLAVDEPHMADRLLSFLFRFLLRPAWHDDVDRQVEFIEFFLSSWPSSAPRMEAKLQALFADALSTRAFIRYLQSKPSDRRRWLLSLASARTTVRRRWGRLLNRFS